MTIGSGIALVVIGAILAFAINVQGSVIDFQVLGDILMAAGVLVFILGVVFTVRRSRSSYTTRTTIDPVTGERIVSQSTEGTNPLR